ncbi:hypothetical protein GCM10027614_46050 [Micromonospora vulcania]
MSIATRNGTGPVEAPVSPPKVVRQRRVRPGLLGLAVLLIALGGLGAAFAVTSVRATGSYLAVARPVEVGREISAADLITVQVAGGQGCARCRPVGWTRWSASGPPSPWCRAPCSPWGRSPTIRCSAPVSSRSRSA